MTLEEELQEIDGVGEKTAEKIMATVADSPEVVTADDLEGAIGMLERGSSRQALSKLKDVS